MRIHDEKYDLDALSSPCPSSCTYPSTFTFSEPVTSLIIKEAFFVDGDGDGDEDGDGEGDVDEDGDGEGHVDEDGQESVFQPDPIDTEPLPIFLQC
jgi:hypothetical protein